MKAIPRRGYYLVSACLLGIKSRYDGRAKPSRFLIKLLKNKPVLLICPEKLGGLPTPRPPAQIVCYGKPASPAGRSIRIITANHKDITRAFKKGARRCLALVKPLCRGFARHPDSSSGKIISVYLKSKSPSCGCGQVYVRDPKTNKISLTRGDGVFAALLKKQHIKVISVN